MNVKESNLKIKEHRFTEMLDGQCQRVDIPVRARTAHIGLPQKRLEEDLY